MLVYSTLYDDVKNSSRVIKKLKYRSDYKLFMHYSDGKYCDEYRYVLENVHKIYWKVRTSNAAMYHGSVTIPLYIANIMWIRGGTGEI